MTLTLSSPDVEPFEPRSDLRAVIAYEDLKAVVRAEALMRRVGNCCGGNGQLIYSLWKFDMLTVNTLCKIAAEEAAAADIIVIAARERDALPDAVLNWIGLWRPVKGTRPKSLVAVLEPEEKQPDDEESPARKGDAGSPGRIYAFLEMLARLDNLSFFTSGIGDASDLELKSTWKGLTARDAAVREPSNSGINSTFGQNLPAAQVQPQ